jgi:2-desacetyl-2-hydroxyethyl bacteriochlorophyllide A dehydrogenase
MGASYLCRSLRVLGVDAPGGMQETWAVPATRLLRVPASLSDDEAALVEPLAVATHDIRRAAVKPGDRVLVLGGGPIGALIAMVAREGGAEVAVSEINPFRVELLRSLGLEVVGTGPALAAHVEGWTDGDGADVVFEVTGNPAAARTMTEFVRVWGTISMVAIHAEPVPVDLYRFFARELTLHGSRLYAREDWDEAIRLAAEGKVALAPLVSRRIPLADLQQGMEEALRGGPVMKVLVDLRA